MRAPLRPRPPCAPEFSLKTALLTSCAHVPRRARLPARPRSQGRVTARKDGASNPQRTTGAARCADALRPPERQPQKAKDKVSGAGRRDGSGATAVTRVTPGGGPGRRSAENWALGLPARRRCAAMNCAGDLLGPCAAPRAVQRTTRAVPEACCAGCSARGRALAWACGGRARALRALRACAHARLWGSARPPREG